MGTREEEQMLLLEQHIDKLVEDVALPSAQRSGMRSMESMGGEKEGKGEEAEKGGRGRRSG